jgi:hypothetical protein
MSRRPNIPGCMHAGMRRQCVARYWLGRRCERALPEWIAERHAKSCLRREYVDVYGLVTQRRLDLRPEGRCANLYEGYLASLAVQARAKILGLPTGKELEM